MEVSNNDVRVMAEAFNLLMQATFNDVGGDKLAPAGAVIGNFQQLIQRLADEEHATPAIENKEGDNETE